GRLGSKSGFEALQHTDLILFLGSEFPFAQFWPKDIKIIQVNNSAFDIGKVVAIDYAVISDAKSDLQAMIATGETLPETAWLTANRQNKRNWQACLAQLAADDSQRLAPEAVTKNIAELAGPKDTYGVDTGNVCEWAVRGLPMDDRKSTRLNSSH